jgi:serine/threonine protein kinase/formylglycine-generating enzyme required for sulfatase activity
MDTDRWLRIKELFRAALPLDPDQRDALLDEACRDDPGLRREIEALLASHADSFLELPTEAELTADEDGPPAARIGQFTVQEVISAGGMGTVYKAEQESPRRTVALKVMREGIASKSALRRFEYEAQILASLDHPNIARVIEAGTHHEDGRDVPYFVMEYIEGAKPLTEYAWEGKAKNSERLRLFLQVCDAVHHGHQKGIIHRDLKPSNLLVDASGQVKVIDFGVARATDSDLALTTAHTAVGQLIGTLQYMSPEQCEADPTDLDIRSDVYALGVVLYELLCEELPYDVRRAVVFEATRIIRETEPRRPTTINRTLQRDVETIVLTALEKDRTRRYQSVASLAADIERYLRGDVILARHAGLGTRAWKRIRKNPVVSVAVAVAFLAIVCSLAYFFFVSYPQLKRERDFAEEQQKIAEDRYAQIIRLSDVKLLADLEAEADTLWPAYPQNVPLLNSWISRAEAVAARLDQHRATLALLREQALPYDGEAERRRRESDPEWREFLALQQARDELVEMIADEGSGGAEERKAMEERLAVLEEQLAGMEGEHSGRRLWVFREEGMEWQHTTLTDLVQKMKHFAHGQGSTLEDVRNRLAFAREITQKSIDDHQAAWDRAVASIENEGYDGLKIEPQVGFVPLGRDPGSGRWEFAHLQTGGIAERGPDGKLEIREETGLVFVLIPGGAFDMGALDGDPEATVDEIPVHRVSLEPFLLSKYEMTQGQWMGFTGENPSMYRPGKKPGGKMVSLVHPVEQVSWEDCVRVLDRLKLRLPSEAEWEYAARAGTTTIYWTGNEKESLVGAVNICDRFARDHGGPPSWKYNLWIDDGYLVHAPVGIYRPNPFGLHDVCGNVFEWCRDSFGLYDDAPTDGSAYETRRIIIRVRRGSCWVSSETSCRSSCRTGGDATYRSNTLGLRPAASLK